MSCKKQLWLLIAANRYFGSNWRCYILQSCRTWSPSQPVDWHRQSCIITARCSMCIYMWFYNNKGNVKAQHQDDAEGRHGLYKILSIITPLKMSGVESLQEAGPRQERKEDSPLAWMRELDIWHQRLFLSTRAEVDHWQHFAPHPLADLSVQAQQKFWPLAASEVS